MPPQSSTVLSHIGRLSETEQMPAAIGLAKLAALGQQTRLSVFRLLIDNEPEGLSAGAIAGAIGCPANTLSTHISILARAGLVRGERDGRSIIYRADIDGMRSLMTFLIADCCGGHPELCGFLNSGSKDPCACGPDASTNDK